jgi:Fe2+ or Zn2+ uptake regulation protein
MTRKKLMKILLTTQYDISDKEIYKIMKLVFKMKNAEIYNLLHKVVYEGEK